MNTHIDFEFPITDGLPKNPPKPPSGSPSYFILPCEGFL